MQYNDMNKDEVSEFVKACPQKLGLLPFAKNTGLHKKYQNTKNCPRWLSGMYVLPHI